MEFIIYNKEINSEFYKTQRYKVVIKAQWVMIL